jgi:hypothetical protein
MLGLLQVPFSWVVGPEQPDLTAGWLLNALLHPLNFVLLFLIGKKIVGRSAFWVTMAAMVNPWVVWLLTEPLAETAFLFFILLTFYLVFRRSRFCYLFAGMASLVRYQGAALILVCFVMDMVYAEDRRARTKAFVYSAAASVPLGLWLTGLILTAGGKGGHLGFFDVGKLSGLANVAKELWLVTFEGMATFAPRNMKLSKGLLAGVEIVAALLFVYGCIWGLIKKRRDIGALLVFFVPYMAIHMAYSWSVGRFYAVVHWIVLLICWFAIQNLWGLINKDGRIPKWIVHIAQGIVVIIIGVWIAGLYPHFGTIKKISPVCAALPYAAPIMAGVGLAGYVLIYKRGAVWSNGVAALLICAIVSSGQFTLYKAVGRAQPNIEFKLLGQWYVNNAIKGARLATTMPPMVGLFAAEYEDSFIATYSIKADSPEEFIEKCYQENISYIAWDSRLGLLKGSYYYINWRLENIAALEKPRTTGVYEFIDQIYVSEKQYINIFMLRKPTGEQ